MDFKSIAYIIDKTADVYITARGNSDDYLSFDSIIVDIKGNKTKEFYEKIIAYYARKGRLKTVCLCCEIAICNKNLSNTDKMSLNKHIKTLIFLFRSYVVN